ncbi:hypothetical protein GGI25_001879 [Coemansia spiralis]|uniref:DUF924-domain-containing protein n=2 Tax=Coemansia TaxID=4863 RepID=A0A9W8KZP3_9FUNG|nr:hypothetical protein BX070DRAFT_150676 [Coemansia spiralis]KAJ1993916.1 hypothetical protein EDC05_001826 [Coemansia umbellata]KAJ2618864.1 hypothetical protein GGI26_006290 [Coemansia sp. RSA 1358]KAJ2679106.1 hypothetical protein GGI25_001879 [Coemansia spiralis]
MLRILRHGLLPTLPTHARTLTTKAESQQLFEKINTFWFGESDRLHKEGKPSFQKWWFEGNPQVDQQIRERFSRDYSNVTKEQIDAAKETPEGTLMMIILLDQMGRNMYRGQAKAFEDDDQAKSLAMYMVRRKFHEALRLVKRSFVFTPLMHAEDMEAQDLSVQMYSELAEQLGEVERDEVRTNGFAKYAEMHRDVIREFGRFPSRNKALGRQSTPEELEWLKNPPF